MGGSDFVDNIGIFVDGPNFINRLLDMQIDKDLISQQLTLEGFRREVSGHLQELDRVEGNCETVEFVCSEKMFGGGQNKFTQEERDFLLDRLGSEPGVHVELVHLPGRDEKGVDGTVVIDIVDHRDYHTAAVLVSADRDFVPLLRRMRERGKKVVTVALNDSYPRELINESFYTLRLGSRYAAFFEYSYPKFNMHEEFTFEKLRHMIANADDRDFNRIQVDVDGDVYIDRGRGGDKKRPGVTFRFESFAPGNEYVGPKGASDKEHVEHYLEEVHTAWQRGAKGYIDYPVDTTWRSREET